MLGSIPGVQQSADALSSLTAIKGEEKNWGDILARSFYDVTDKQVDLEGQYKMRLRHIMGKLTKAQKNQFLQVATHEITKDAADPIVQQAITDSYKLGDDLGREARQAEIPVFGPEGEEGVFQAKQEYYPVILNPDTLKAIQVEKGPRWDDLVNWIANDLEARNLEYLTTQNVIREATRKWSLATRKKQAAAFLRDRRRYDLAGTRYFNLLQSLKGGGVSMPEIAAKMNRSLQLHRAFDYPMRFRLDDPYETWERHIDSATRRIAEAIVWGQENPKTHYVDTNGLLKQWAWAAKSQAEKKAKLERKSPDDAARKVLELLSHILGYESGIEALQSNMSREMKNGLRIARVVTSAVHLSAVKPGLKNILYGMVSAAVHYGPAKSLKHFAATLLHPQTRIALAQEAGALEHSGIRQLFEGTKFSSRVVTALRLSMTLGEYLNRTASAFANSEIVNKAVAKAHRKYQKTGQLEVPPWLMRAMTDREVGFRAQQVTAMVQRGILDNDERRKAMRGGAKVTQFLADAKDLPKWAGTEGGRFWSQFWAMAYKASQNTIGYALEEMGHGNLRPLINFLVLVLMGGIAYPALKRWFRGEPFGADDQDKLEKTWNFLKEAAKDDVPGFVGETIGWAAKPFRIVGETTQERVARGIIPAPIGTAASIIAAASATTQGLVKEDKEKTNKGLERLAKTTGIGRDVFRAINAVKDETDQDRLDKTYRDAIKPLLKEGGQSKRIAYWTDWGKKHKINVKKETDEAKSTVRQGLYDELWQADKKNHKDEAARLRKRLRELGADTQDINQSLENRKAKAEGREPVHLGGGSSRRKSSRTDYRQDYRKSYR